MMTLTFVMFVALMVLMICLKSREQQYAAYSSFDDEQSSFGIADEASRRSSAASSASQRNSMQSSVSSHIELQETSIPVTRYLSPSMYMLLALKVGQSVIHQVYCIAAPVAFVTAFGITSQIGGMLHGAAAVCGVIGIYMNGKIGGKVKKWEYPWDVSLYFAIITVSCMMYVIFYQRWIAFSFHILIMGSNFTLFGIEMTSRLFLCPSQAFHQITGFVGMLQVTCLLISVSFIVNLFHLQPLHRYKTILGIVLSVGFNHWTSIAHGFPPIPVFDFGYFGLLGVVGSNLHLFVATKDIGTGFWRISRG